MKSSVLFECGPLPPMSTSRPPDVFHLISIPRPSPYFAALSLLCIIEQKMGEAWERGYTEYVCIPMPRFITGSALWTDHNNYCIVFSTKLMLSG